MIVLAIDPGPSNSAWVLWDGERILDKGLELNEGVLARISNLWFDRHGRPEVLAIEKVVSYGMPVGAETFETCVWTGRFIQAWAPGEVLCIPRKDVVSHHNHSVKGNDATVRQAMFDRFGVKGTKKQPGLLYGVVKDIMAAFALAVYVTDNRITAVALEAARSA